jgi:predicted  nucleic acid-binding Zn-ribbon protein
MNEDSKLALRYLQRIDERMIRIEERIGDFVARVDRVAELCDGIAIRLDLLNEELLRIDRQLRSPD